MINPNPEKMIVGFIGIIGGMARYTHLVLMFDTTVLTRMIEPVCTGILCVFGSLLAKDMYKWIKAAYFKTILPWAKSLFTRKK